MGWGKNKVRIIERRGPDGRPGWYCHVCDEDLVTEAHIKGHLDGLM